MAKEKLPEEGLEDQGHVFSTKLPKGMKTMNIPSRHPNISFQHYTERVEAITKPKEAKDKERL